MGRTQPRIHVAAGVIVLSWAILVSMVTVEDAFTTGVLGDPPAAAEVFAPGVISTEAYEFAVSFTPDMREMYFTRRSEPGLNHVFVASIENGRVTDCAPASFNDDTGTFEPCVSPDGGSITFGQGDKLRYCTRVDDGWSKAEDLPPQLNEGFTMALWVDGAGNYYFTREQGLMVARYDKGEYADAVLLAPQFGPPAGDAAHGFVSPDASYVVFDSQSRNPDGGRGDLFVSQRVADGSWTEPRELEELNTPATEMCASVSPDGRSLLFCRDGEIYWVDASILGVHR